jgi:hypothetical protein
MLCNSAVYPIARSFNLHDHVEVRTMAPTFEKQETQEKRIRSSENARLKFAEETLKDVVMAGIGIGACVWAAKAGRVRIPPEAWSEIQEAAAIVRGGLVKALGAQPKTAILITRDGGEFNYFRNTLLNGVKQDHISGYHPAGFKVRLYPSGARSVVSEPYRWEDFGSGEHIRENHGSFSAHVLAPGEIAKNRAVYNSLESNFYSGGPINQADVFWQAVKLRKVQHL